PDGRPRGPGRRRPKRPSILWRYRRVWVLFGLLGLTALAGVAWVITHVPLPPEVPQAQTSIVYDASGAQIATFHGDENRFPVKLDQVPKVTIDAVIAAEDRKFFQHRGIDPLGIARATWADIRRRGVRQGGSTITQQYVKNAFVGGGHERTLSRKLKEAIVAVKVESKYSKQEILERYLNTVYFGRGAYGIQAAAKAYYDKDAAQLDLKESAYLVGLIRTPSEGDVATDPLLAEDLRTIVLNAMVEQRSITRAQADEAEAIGLSSYVKPRKASETTVTSSIKGVEYFVEYVRQQLLSTHTIDEILRGGLRIHTTLDPRLQDLAYDAVYGDTLNRVNDPAGALVSLDPDGRVVAMVGGKDWAASKVNLAVGAEGGGGGRQAGSTFKPFLLAETVRQGYSVESSFAGPSKIVLPKADAGADWEVENYEGASYGRINLIDATANSVNTVYAQLTMAIGPEAVADMARKLGVKKSKLNSVVSLPLGTGNVSVLEMADAYLTFANEGMQTDPRVIKRVTVGESTIVDDEPERTRVLEREQANVVNFVLRQVVDRGSGVRARLPTGPAWGKTGTTEDYGDAWFVGYNRKLTTAVWMGYPGGQSQGLFNVHGWSRVSGGTLPAEIWRRFMSSAAPDRSEFPKPTSLGGKSFAGGVIRYRDKSATTVPAVTTPRAPASTVPKDAPVPTTAAVATTAPPWAESPPTTARAQSPPQTNFTIPDFTVPERIRRE
ncbi:MAG TPA: transglycosylase domain-containing protein, partial [Acidimicrobiales bacterium]|nr:transglycosylase domain-containing protein [Acidimicrobiales bacterium]